MSTAWWPSLQEADLITYPYTRPKTLNLTRPGIGIMMAKAITAKGAHRIYLVGHREL
jgi:hypothetical protein